MLKVEIFEISRFSRALKFQILKIRLKVIFAFFTKSLNDLSNGFLQDAAKIFVDGFSVEEIIGAEEKVPRNRPEPGQLVIAINHVTDSDDLGILTFYPSLTFVTEIKTG